MDEKEEKLLETLFEGGPIDLKAWP